MPIGARPLKPTPRLVGRHAKHSVTELQEYLEANSAFAAKVNKLLKQLDVDGDGDLIVDTRFSSIFLHMGA